MVFLFSYFSFFFVLLPAFSFFPGLTIFADSFLFIDGFFDAGMLQAALKARGEDHGRPSETITGRREIGRRLTLAEY